MVFDARQCLSTLTVKALLIILPKRSLIESRQCNGKWKKKKQREDAAQKIFYGKNHETKSLMGPLKSLGTPRKYPLFPLSRWAWSLALHCTITHINMLTDRPSHLVFDLQYHGDQMLRKQIYMWNPWCSNFLRYLLSATADCDPKVCWLLEHSLWSARDPAEDTRGGALEAAGYHCHAGRTWRTPWPHRQCRTFSLIQGLPWARRELFGGSHLARWGK